MPPPQIWITIGACFWGILKWVNTGVNVWTIAAESVEISSAHVITMPILSSHCWTATVHPFWSITPTICFKGNCIRVKTWQIAKEDTDDKLSLMMRRQSVLESLHWNQNCPGHCCSAAAEIEKEHFWTEENKQSTLKDALVQKNRWSTKLCGFLHFLPQYSNIFTQIYLPYQWYFATLMVAHRHKV